MCVAQRHPLRWCLKVPEFAKFSEACVNGHVAGKTSSTREPICGCHLQLVLISSPKRSLGTHSSLESSRIFFEFFPDSGEFGAFGPGGPERLQKMADGLQPTPLGKCEGSRLVGGTGLVVFPRCLTPYRPKNTTSREPYPPSSRDPPFRPGPLPPFCTSLGRARGKGSRLERGSRLVALSNCGRFGRGNTTSRVPPTSRDPLPLLIPCFRNNFCQRPLSWSIISMFRSKAQEYILRFHHSSRQPEIQCGSCRAHVFETCLGGMALSAIFT